MGGRFAHYLGAVSEHVAGVVNFYGRASIFHDRTSSPSYRSIWPS